MKISAERDENRTSYEAYYRVHYGSDDSYDVAHIVHRMSMPRKRSHRDENRSPLTSPVHVGYTSQRSSSSTINQNVWPVDDLLRSEKTGLDESISKIAISNQSTIPEVDHTKKYISRDTTETDNQHSGLNQDKSQSFSSTGLQPPLCSDEFRGQFKRNKTAYSQIIIKTSDENNRARCRESNDSNTTLLAPISLGRCDLSNSTDTIIYPPMEPLQTVEPRMFFGSRKPTAANDISISAEKRTPSPGPLNGDNIQYEKMRTSPLETRGSDSNVHILEPATSGEFVLDMNLWTRVDRGEYCRAELCSLRNNVSLIARRRHYHAKCEHRHSSGIKSGMRFHHHQMEKIRKHQSAHLSEENRSRGSLMHLNASAYAIVKKAGMELHQPQCWTEAATKSLAGLVGDHPGRTMLPWVEIPSALLKAHPGFHVSAQQCLLHWRIVVNGNKTVTGVKTWSKIEDDRLAALVGLFGPKWSLITQMLPGREPKQCRERFLNVVDPGNSHKAWTSDEDALLIRVHDKSCNRFAQTAKFFSSRSYKEVKDRWHQIRRSEKYFNKKPIEYNIVNPSLDYSNRKRRKAPADTVRTTKSGEESEDVDACEQLASPQKFYVKQEFPTERDFFPHSRSEANGGTKNFSLEENGVEIAHSLLGLRQITEH